MSALDAAVVLPARRNHAVIDIGSNSVRLVVYRVEGRANAPILNEKVLAGLGRDAQKTGRLNPEGARRALAALARYRLLVDAMAVDRADVVATAAVREAADGPAFVAEVARRAGFQVRIASGQEEGRLSALGVLAGAPGATGVAGDLGGSSLELVRLAGEEADQPGALAPAPTVEGGESWQLGPLAMGAGEGADIEAMRRRIDAVLERSGVLRGVTGGEFHAVGGAWRALARINMQLHHYPLRVLHNYAIRRQQALETCAFVARQSRKSVAGMDPQSGKRAETVPYGAVLLERLLLAAPFETVVISSHGLREGILYEQLSDAEREQDPLVAGAVAMIGSDPRAVEFGRTLFSWISPLFQGLPRLFPKGRGRVVRLTTCLLSDLGATLHPDDRARIAFELALRAPYPAASHVERAFIARALARRYTARPDWPEAGVIASLLDPDQRRRADGMGAAMRLGADLSGRSAEILARCPLALEDGMATLSVPQDYADLLAEHALKRLDQLGETLGLPVRTRTL
jgi:exopolyphosphatase / guanosine-5'-triphosphate,3'-diphosphate pyrophosphatase